MIYFHKILPVLLSPIFVFIVLVIIGAWKKWNKICYIATVGFWLLATPIVSNSLFRYIEDYAVIPADLKIPKANFIVCLGGFLSNSPSEDGRIKEWVDPDRFFASLKLFKLGKSDKLIFTNSKLPWEIINESEGDVLRRAAIDSNIPSESIFLTHEVSNTREEAAAVSALISGSSGQIILVTSAFHMPRAKFIFEKEGMSVIPYPVDFKVTEQVITLMDFLPNVRALSLSDIAIREIIGLIYYRFKY